MLNCSSFDFKVRVLHHLLFLVGLLLVINFALQIIIHSSAYLDSLLEGPSRLKENTSSLEAISHNNISSDAELAIIDGPTTTSSSSNDNQDSDDERPRNLHIAFLGDSVTRFQYASFVFYLHHGRHLKDSDRPNPLRESLLVENSHGELVVNFSEILLHPQEQCDCYRTYKWNPSQFTDNRYYLDTKRNNSVSFLLKYGKLEVHGHWPTAIVHEEHKMITEYEDPEWKGDWTTAIHHLAQLAPPPKYLIFNAGIHRHDLNNPQVRESIQQALNKTGIIGIFKLTTFGRGGLENGWKWKHHEEAMCEMLSGRCLDYTWTRNLPKRAYFDHIHLYVLRKIRPCQTS